MTQSLAASSTGRPTELVNFASGIATGDGTAITLTLGFKARHVKVVNSTDVIVWEKIEGMAAADSVKTVTGGTTTVDSGSAILINSDKSTVTLSATLGASAKALAWVAYG